MQNKQPSVVAEEKMIWTTYLQLYLVFCKRLYKLMFVTKIYTIPVLNYMEMESTINHFYLHIIWQTLHMQNENITVS